MDGEFFNIITFITKVSSFFLCFSSRVLVYSYIY